MLGCAHHSAQPLILPQQTPVALESPPLLSEPLPMVEEPGTELPAVPVVDEEPEMKPKRRTHPLQTAATGAVADHPGGSRSAEGGGPSGEGAVPDESVTSTDIGVFSVGGEQNPRSKHDAETLIASNDRRLSGLNLTLARAQASLVSKVRTFQRDAVQALTSGDAEGAKTLATKGKLMLDDLERGVPSQ